jgi:hypothetical protein
MVLSLERLHPDAPPAAWRHWLLIAATIAGWLLLVGAVGSLYVGHSSSPYGTCTAPSGRQVDCTLLRHR